MKYTKPALRPIAPPSETACLDGSGALNNLDCTVGPDPLGSECDDGGFATGSGTFDACADGSKAYATDHKGCSTGGQAGSHTSDPCNTGTTPVPNSCVSGTGAA